MRLKFDPNLCYDLIVLLGWVLLLANFHKGMAITYDKLDHAVDQEFQ
jgi:hypothetical protein